MLRNYDYPQRTDWIRFLRQILHSVWLYRAIRWTLAGLFLMAGIIKLQDPKALALTIDAFGLIPRPVIVLLAVLLPIVEVTAAAGLIFEVRGCLGVITGLIVGFIGVLSYGIALGLDIDCGCFGPGDPEGEAFHSIRSALVRDFFMLAGATFLYTWRCLHPVRFVRPWSWIQRN